MSNSYELDGTAAAYVAGKIAGDDYRIVYVGETDAISRPFDNDREGCCHRRGVGHVFLHHEADEQIRFRIGMPAMSRDCRRSLLAPVLDKCGRIRCLARNGETV